MSISKELYDTLIEMYTIEIKQCKTTLLIYFEKSVGISEHSNHLEEMDKLIEKASSAYDKLNMLKQMFKLSYSKL
jgi:hypothetical protein